MMIHSISKLMPFTGQVIRPEQWGLGSNVQDVVPGLHSDRRGGADASGAMPGQPKIDAPVNQLERYLQHANYNLQFSIDEASGRSIIRVVDAHTGEVIRQFPMEEILGRAKAALGSGGLLFSDRA